MAARVVADSGPPDGAPLPAPARGAGHGSLPPVPPAGPGGPVDPRLPGGGGRVRAPDAAVLGRQGLHRHAAPGAEGLLAGAGALPRAPRGHRAQLRRGARVPGPPHGRRRRAAGGGQGAGRHRRRPDGRGHVAGRHAQPAADADPAAGHRGGPSRRRLRRGPPGRGEGPGQGAHLQLPRRVRPVGSQEPAPRAVEPLQRPAQQGRAHPGLPALELDRARRVELHPGRGDRRPADLLRPSARGLPA